MADETLVLQLSADAKIFIKQFKESEQQLTRFQRVAKATGESVKTSLLTMSKAAATVAGAGFAALGAGMGVSIKRAADFESAMSRVGALSGATGAEFTALSDKAKELGATTAFTGQQAAEGMQFLAMAGFESNDIVSAMPGLLAAASAGQLDLATTADIVSNVLSGFGIEAERTGEVADLMTAAFTSSNTNLQQLGDAMKFVAPVAADLNVSIETVTAGIGLLSNAGIQGAMAGTNMRAALLRLTAPTDQAAALMKRLGVETTNADGSMREFPAILSDLNSSMSGMTDAQRAQTLATLVGQRAISGFSVLLGAAATGEMQEYIDQLENVAGTAEEIADQQLDNLQGQLTLLSSAIDGVAVGVGDSFLPILTDMVRGLTELTSQHGPEVIRIFSDLAESIGSNMGPAMAVMQESWGRIVVAFGESPSQITPVGTALSALEAILNTVVTAMQATAIATEKVAAGIEGWTHSINQAQLLVNAFLRVKNESGSLIVSTDDLAVAYQDLATEQAEYQEQQDLLTFREKLLAAALDETAQAERVAADNAEILALSTQGVEQQQAQAFLTAMGGVEAYRQLGEAMHGLADIEIDPPTLDVEQLANLRQSMADFYNGINDLRQENLQRESDAASKLNDVRNSAQEKQKEIEQSFSEELAEIERDRQDKIHWVLTGAHARTAAENDAALAHWNGHFDQLVADTEAKYQQQTDKVTLKLADQEQKIAESQARQRAEYEQHLEELKLQTALGMLETSGQLEQLTGGVATSASEAADLIQAGIIPVTQEMGLAIQGVLGELSSSADEASATATSNQEILQQAMQGTLDQASALNQSFTDGIEPITAYGDAMASVTGGGGGDAGEGLGSGLSQTLADSQMLNTVLGSELPESLLALGEGHTEMFGVFTDESLAMQESTQALLDIFVLLSEETTDLTDKYIVLGDETMPNLQKSGMAAALMITATMSVAGQTGKKAGDDTAQAFARAQRAIRTIHPELLQLQRHLDAVAAKAKAAGDALASMRRRGSSGSESSQGKSNNQDAQRLMSRGTNGFETVPTGFPNDSYLIGLTSGERFSVLPVGAQDNINTPSFAIADTRQGGGSVIYNIGPVHMHGMSDPARFFDQLEREARSRGKQFSRVV